MVFSAKPGLPWLGSTKWRMLWTYSVLGGHITWHAASIAEPVGKHGWGVNWCHSIWGKVGKFLLLFIQGSRIQDAKCMNISQNTVKRQCWCGSTFVQPSKARWWYLVHLGHVNEFRSVRQNDLSIHWTKTDQWPKNGWGIKKFIIGIKKIREDQKKNMGIKK